MYQLREKLRKENDLFLENFYSEIKSTTIYKNLVSADSSIDQLELITVIISGNTRGRNNNNLIFSTPKGPFLGNFAAKSSKGVKKLFS